MIKIFPLVVLAATCFAGADELDVRLRPTVVGCGNAQLPALPVSRAPFERSAEVSRRPVALATFPFFARNSGAGPDYAQRFVQWAEFVSGDKIAVVNGYDWRICHHGRTGFGKVMFYRSDADADSQSFTAPEPFGRELLVWMEIRFLDGASQYDVERDVFRNAILTVDAKAGGAEWSRPVKMDGTTNAVARYSIAKAGDGKLALEWNTGGVPVEFRLHLCGKSTQGQHGVENGTRIYVNRDRETDRVEIAFPDGTARAEGSSAYVWRTDAASGRVMIDLCGSTVASAAGSFGVSEFDARHSSRTPKLQEAKVTAMCMSTSSGIIDFWKEDAVDVPRDPTGNQLANGSFEQGLTGWNYWWNGEPWSVVDATGEPLESITGEAKVGDRALRMRSSKPRGTYEAIQSAPISIEPGEVHKLSAWVKRASGEKGKAEVSFLADNASQLGIVRDIEGNPAKTTVALEDDEWHFVELAFTSVIGDLKIVLSGSGAAVVVDGVRVEKTGNGERGTGNGFSRVERVEHVEGRLETANPDNLLHFGEPINARLVLSGPDGVEGSVRVMVRNFYNETVYDKTFAFKLPENKVLPLDFDPAKLGTGVFVLGTEFVMGGPTSVSAKNTDATERVPPARYRSPYQRLAILKPLDGKHATANFYVQFPYYEKSSNGEKLARYAKALGYTTVTWELNSLFADENAPTVKLRRKYGISARLHCLSSELARKYPDRFGHGKEGLKAFTNAVPEQIEFIEKEAYLAGLGAAEDDTWWALWNEEDGQMPTLRGGKSSEEIYAACEAWFPYQYACWKGLKKAFDERGLKLMYGPTHGSCNYNDPGRREMMDAFMDIAAKHGFHYDFIAVHTYHAIDKSVLGSCDRDENAALLLSRMAHYGYPETTPVMFSEGFNNLPFVMQRWNTEVSADNYPNGGPASLDLGWREFLQAGAMARLYIMDLKYWPRVMTSHTWQGRLVADVQMSPFMWNMVPNTLGHLLPSPKFLGDVKRDGWRAYVFRQGDYGVAAVWTNERQAELGRNKGMTLSVNLPEDVRFVDLMGNRRTALSRDEGGAMAIPLTPAPLFIVSRDAEGLLKAFENSTPDKMKKIDIKPVPDPSVRVRPPQVVPVLQSDRPQIDKAFKLAVETLYRNAPGDLIKAGGKYGGEWTRDISINSWNAAALLIPEKAVFSLWSVTKNDRTLVGHEYWDKIIWATAAYDFYLKSGDREFLKQAYIASANTMKELEKEQFDADYGLFMGPSVFNDGIAGYEEPVFETGHRSSHVLDYPGSKRIKCLSTNCIYFSGYRVLAIMASLEGDEASAKEYARKAAALKAAIRRHLYDAKTGRTNYLIDTQGGVHPHQEALGLSFAILFGILDGDEARKAIAETYVSRFGIPSIYPHFKRFDKDHPGRHNQIVWPFVNAFWADAVLSSGRTDLFSFELQNLAGLALANDCFYEIYNETTGKVDGGWQVGRHWDSVFDQTWSATGYLRMVFSGLFGMKFSPDGVVFSPECSLLGEYGVKRLTGLRYRDGFIDITVSGKGSRLAAVKVNGRSQPPSSPVPPAAGTTEIELVLD